MTKVLRWIGIGVRRMLVALVLWVLSLALWWRFLAWIETDRVSASRAGVLVDPDFGLLMSLPIWLLILSWYLASPVVTQLERLWSRHGW